MRLVGTMPMPSVPSLYQEMPSNQAAAADHRHCMKVGSDLAMAVAVLAEVQLQSLAPPLAQLQDTHSNVNDRFIARTSVCGRLVEHL